MPRSHARTVVGTLVALLGFALLLDTTDLAPVPDLSVFAPAVLVAFGVWLFVRRGLRRPFLPLALALVGVSWQLVALDVLTASEARAFWPLLVVLLALSMVFGRRTRRRSGGTRHSGQEAMAVLGERRTNFVGAGEASAVAVLGETRFDLRDADGNVAVDAVAVLGEVELVVPADWRVELGAVGVLGEVEDRRRTPADGADPDAPTVTVDGIALLGSVTVVD